MLQYKQCFWQYSFAPPGSWHQLNSGLHIALLPILFAVAALLFSRWLAEGCALREENEGFI